MQLIAATNNAGKLRELHALLNPLVPVSPAELDLDLEVEENGWTFAENAALKAHAFARETGLIALAGIDAARAVGFAPLKFNAVAMRGVNEDELVDLVRFAVDHEAEMRFIEQMPLDAGHIWSRVEMVRGEEILDTLRQAFTLEPVGERGASPAEVFHVDGGPATVGVIASVTAPFCGACDRVRLTADGQIRNCLFAREESDLLPLLRGDADDDDLADVLRRSIAGKLPGHGIDEPGFLQPQRPMSAIGG